MPFPFERLRHLLIDLDGVIYRGDTPLRGAARFLAFLRERGITVRLVTNNATLTPQQYVAKLDAMGITVDTAEIFTSALATGLYLREHRNGTSTALVIGETGLRDAVTAAGLLAARDNPDWVVMGLDRHVTYEDLAAAALAIEGGARFVGSNPDTSFPSERGLVPGAGALIGAVRLTTGVEPTIIGKPHPLMLELALHSLGGTVEDTAMLGDRLDTDILAASNLHMPSILVLTGVSTEEEVRTGSIHPDLVVPSLGALMNDWPGT
ncbi:MAG TPA: HAD-IIA family hydrolase [Chloroflexota bacterium]|nr:HAD-IIA family hydrolase [Chloroflexota bacterium]